MFTKGPVEKFLRKLAGMADLEGALKKLDRLTQEEARMALAEVLRITDNVRDEVKVVEGKVENVDDKVEGLGVKVEDVDGKVEDIDDNVKVVIDKVQCVDERVQVVINGARGVSTLSPISSNVHTFRRQGSKSSSAGSKIDYSTDRKRDRRSQVFVTCLLSPLLVAYAGT